MAAEVCHCVFRSSKKRIVNRGLLMILEVVRALTRRDGIEIRIPDAAAVRRYGVNTVRLVSKY